MDIQSQILEMLKLQQFQQQQQQFQQQQLKFQQRLAEIQIQSDKKIKILTQFMNKNIQSCDSFTQNAVWSAIETFKYQPNEDISFEAYFKPYKDIYTNDCKN